MIVFTFIVFLFSKADYHHLPFNISIPYSIHQVPDHFQQERNGPPPCSMVVDPQFLFSSSIPCFAVPNSGSIIFQSEGISGGTPPYTYDWDALSTPYNDNFDPDGEYYLDSVPAGFYRIIVTDHLGCSASAMVEVEGPQSVSVTTQIDSVKGCVLTGSIQITSFLGPPMYLNYNWDYANTAFDDDFGTGTENFGLPPEENDAEDLLSNLKGGIYYLTITMRVEPDDTIQECIFRDTFNIWSEQERVFCPFGNISLFAGTSDPLKTYQWQMDSLGSFLNINPDAHYSGTSAPILLISNTPSSWYGYRYRCIISQGTEMTYSEIFTLIFRDCWKGNWNLWTNNYLAWNCSCLPDKNIDVFIGSGLPQYPELYLTNAYCRSLTLKPGAKLKLTNNTHLFVKGDNP
ncbi:MAG TPA: hypothetical protein VFG10_10685 [Saprospiraceae bacterium]|nr:hypothetical protein [Saprospiraceae bacterium]